MIFELIIQKLDTYAQNPYVVFGLEGDGPTEDNRHRPRPKLTLDSEQWERLGKPVTLTADVQAADAEIAVH